MKGEVLCYTVQSFDEGKKEWCPRYSAMAHYHRSERTKVVGYLWWKKRVRESFTVYEARSRRRAFMRAIRRAKSLPEVNVRIIMEIVYPDRRDVSYPQVWTT